MEGFTPVGLDLPRDKGTFLCYIEVLHDPHRPCIEGLRALNSLLPLRESGVLYLGDAIHTYAVSGCELSGQIEDVLERSSEASTQIVEGLNGIADGRDGCCGIA